ncbi:DA1-like protein [Drosera capensis]
MGWLSKIFEGSNGKGQEDQFYNEHSENQALDDPSTSGQEVWNQYENEDIDRGIVLSLLEEEQRAKQLVDHESQLKEDEMLARSLQDSLGSASPPRYEYGNGHKSQTMFIPYPTGYRICAGCYTKIGYGRFLSCMGAIWHPECFRCHACNLPISGYEEDTHITGHATRNTIIRNVAFVIPTNPAGLIQYRAHPFWDQKYCPQHEHDGTPRCCSCERMEPRGMGYVSLEPNAENSAWSVWIPQSWIQMSVSHSIKIYRFRMLNPQIEEGMCQVLAHMWLESQLKSSSGSSRDEASSSSSSESKKPPRRTRSPFETKLGKFFKSQIESDISPVYGDGFRAANHAVFKCGLGRTLDHLQMTGCLPH